MELTWNVFSFSFTSKWNKNISLAINRLWDTAVDGKVFSKFLPLFKSFDCVLQMQTTIAYLN